jgi:hypothetical protein
MGAETTETVPAAWNEAGENLSRYAASARLETLADKDAQKKLALQYGLMSELTSFFMVHERELKADKLPALERVPQALARDWPRLVTRERVRRVANSILRADSRSGDPRLKRQLVRPPHGRAFGPNYLGSNYSVRACIDPPPATLLSLGETDFADFNWENPQNGDIIKRGFQIDDYLNGRPVLSSEFGSLRNFKREDASLSGFRRDKTPFPFEKEQEVASELDSLLREESFSGASATLSACSKTFLDSALKSFSGETGSVNAEKEIVFSYIFLFLLGRIGDYYMPWDLSYVKAKIFLASVPLEKMRPWREIAEKCHAHLIFPPHLFALFTNT